MMPLQTQPEHSEAHHVPQDLVVMEHLRLGLGKLFALARDFVRDSYSTVFMHRRKAGIPYPILRWGITQEEDKDRIVTRVSLNPKDFSSHCKAMWGSHFTPYSNFDLLKRGEMGTLDGVIVVQVDPSLVRGVFCVSSEVRDYEEEQMDEIKSYYIFHVDPPKDSP